MLQSQWQEGNSPPLKNVFRIAFNWQEGQGHCKFLYQPPLRARTSHLSVRSSCSEPHPAAFNYPWEWSLDSLSEQPVSTFDQPFSKNFVYKCLTWISAVATSPHCAVCPLQAFVHNSWLGVSGDALSFLATIFHWICSNKMFGFLLDH